jgi:hypothetical protein
MPSMRIYLPPCSGTSFGTCSRESRSFLGHTWSFFCRESYGTLLKTTKVRCTTGVANANVHVYILAGLIHCKNSGRKALQKYYKSHTLMEA